MSTPIEEFEQVICPECVLPECIRSNYGTNSAQDKRGCLLSIARINKLSPGLALESIKITLNGPEVIR